MPNCILLTPNETCQSIQRFKAIPNSISDILDLIHLLQHPKQYKFNTDSQTILKKLNTEFINDLSNTGMKCTTNKKVDIAVKQVVGIHVFEQVAAALIQG